MGGLALKVLRKSGITLAYKSRDVSEQGLQLGALCCLEVMTAPSPGVVGMGQGDAPAPLQFPPAVILGKHQGSQSCHARPTSTSGQSLMGKPHCPVATRCCPARAPLAAGLHWCLTGPAASWLRASCFSLEEWCCGHRKVTALNSQGPLEGTSTLWNIQHGLSAPVGPPGLRWLGGLAFTELVCMAKEVIQ